MIIAEVSENATPPGLVMVSVLPLSELVVMRPSASVQPPEVLLPDEKTIRGQVTLKLPQVVALGAQKSLARLIR